MLSDQLQPCGIAPIPTDFLGFSSGFGLGTYVCTSPSGRQLCGWSGLAGAHVCFEPASGYYVIVIKQTLPFTWAMQARLVGEWPEIA